MDELLEQHQVEEEVVVPEVTPPTPEDIVPEEGGEEYKTLSEQLSPPKQEKEEEYLTLNELKERSLGFKGDTLLSYEEQLEAEQEFSLFSELNEIPVESWRSKRIISLMDKIKQKEELGNLYKEGMVKEILYQSVEHDKKVQTAIEKLVKGIQDSPPLKAYMDGAFDAAKAVAQTSPTYVPNVSQKLFNTSEEDLKWKAHLATRLDEIAPGIFGWISGIAYGLLPHETLDHRQVVGEVRKKKEWKSSKFKEELDKRSGLFSKSALEIYKTVTDIYFLQEAFDALPDSEKYNALEDIIDMAGRFDTKLSKWAFLTSFFAGDEEDMFTSSTWNFGIGLGSDILAAPGTAKSVIKLAKTVKNGGIRSIRGASKLKAYVNMTGAPSEEALARASKLGTTETVIKPATSIDDIIDKVVNNVPGSSSGVDEVLSSINNKGVRDYFSISVAESSEEAINTFFRDIAKAVEEGKTLTSTVRKKGRILVAENKKVVRRKATKEGLKRVKRDASTLEEVLKEGVTVQLNAPDGTSRTFKLAIDPETGNMVRRGVDTPVKEFMQESGTLITAKNAEGGSIKPLSALVDFFGFDRFLLPRDITQTISRATYQDHRWLTAFSNQFRDVFDSIPLLKRGKAQDNVWKVLKHLDGKEVPLPSVQELRRGITTAFGDIKLNDYEIEAFYKTRALFDDMYKLGNQIDHNVKHLAGFKTIQAEGATFDAIPIEEARRVNYYIDASNPKRVKLTPLGEAGISKKEVTRRMKEGEKLVEVREPRNFFKDAPNKPVYLLVEESAIKALRLDTLKRTPNYIPRLFNTIKARWWALGSGQGELRPMAFATREAAEAWAEVANKGLAQETLADITKSRRYIVKEATELGAAEGTAMQRKALFGQYSPPDTIVFGDRTNPGWMGSFDDLPPTVDMVGTLERSFSKLASEISNHEIRISMQQKFLDLVKDVETKTGKRVLLDPNNPASPISPGLDPRLTRGVKRLQHYIGSRLGFMNKEDNILRSTMKDITSWMEPKVTSSDTGRKVKEALTPVREFGYKVAVYDPLRFVMGTNYELLIGMFNISQLLVQGAGAAQAISLHPQYAPTAFKRYAVLRAMNNADFITRGNGDIVGAVGKAFMNEKEAVALNRLWKETGLGAGLNQQHYASTLSEGISKNSLQKVLALGKIPVNEGERFARMVSYNICLEEYMKKNGITKIAQLTTTDNAKILDRTLDIYYDLSMANRARYTNNPFTAIPLQFTTVINNAFQTMFSKNISGWDKFKILAGQIVLFGTVGGIPAGTLISTLIDQVTGAGSLDEKEMVIEKTEARQAMERGLLNSLLKGLGIEPLAIETRMALFGSPYFVDMWQEGISPTAMTGATYTILGRGQVAFDSLKLAIMSTFSDEGLSFDERAWSNAINDFGKITSSYTNLEKAWAMTNGEIRSSSGKLEINYGGRGTIPSSTIALQALGFEPNIANQMRLLQRKTIGIEIRQKAAADHILHYLRGSSRLLDLTGNDEILHGSKKVAYTGHLILSSFGIDTEYQRSKVWRSVLDSMDKTKDQRWVKTFLRWMDTTGEHLPPELRKAVLGR